MNDLSTRELHEVEGGNGIAIGLGIFAGITFIIGVIDGYVRPLKCNQEVFMKDLKNNELFDIDGGVSISGTFINSITRGIDTILDMGRSVGSAIRRIGSGNVCPL